MSELNSLPAYSEAITVDLNDDTSPRVTWQPCSGQMLIKITTNELQVDMAIGKEAIRQLKQALSRA